MKIIKFLAMFLVIFIVFGITLTIPIDCSFYDSLKFNLIKPSVNFFNIFNLIYIFLFSISISELLFAYSFNKLENSFILKLVFNIFSFTFIKIFFNMHNLLLTFISSMCSFISLLYIYESISSINEKSTKYLDINVIYTLLLSAFLFCMYVLNSY